MQIEAYRNYAGDLKIGVIKHDRVTVILSRDEALKLRDELTAAISEYDCEKAIAKMHEEKDPSPLCPCNTCGPAGPFTCVRKD